MTTLDEDHAKEKQKRAARRVMNRAAKALRTPLYKQRRVEQTPLHRPTKKELMRLTNDE